MTTEIVARHAGHDGEKNILHSRTTVLAEPLQEQAASRRISSRNRRESAGPLQIYCIRIVCIVYLFGPGRLQRSYSQTRAAASKRGALVIHLSNSPRWPLGPAKRLTVYSHLHLLGYIVKGKRRPMAARSAPNPDPHCALRDLSRAASAWAGERLLRNQRCCTNPPSSNRSVTSRRACLPRGVPRNPHEARTAPSQLLTRRQAGDSWPSRGSGGPGWTCDWPERRR